MTLLNNLANNVLLNAEHVKMVLESVQIVPVIG